MIVSERLELEKKVQEWLIGHDAPVNTFNVLTALDSMNLLASDSGPPIDSSYSITIKRNIGSYSGLHTILYGEIG